MFRLTAMRVFTSLFLMVLAPELLATELGPVQAQSYLGQPFNATIPVLGVSRNVMIAGCFKAKIESASGALLAVPHIDVNDYDRDAGIGQITLTSREAISEPVIRVSVSLACEDAVLRTYSMMLDYPERIGPLAPQAVTAPKADPVREFSGPMPKIVPANDVADDQIKMNVPKPTPQSAVVAVHPAGAGDKPGSGSLSPVIRDEIERESTQQQLKTEEQKVAGLESELSKLKMDYQIRTDKEQEKAKEQQTPPVLLIILDLVVIMLLVAAIALAAYFIGKKPKPSLH